MESLDQTQILLLLVAVAGVAFMLGRATGGGGNAEDRAQKAMEERQEAERLFASLSPEVQQEVDALIADGKMIEGIKLVREHAGVGLKEAKKAVEMRRTSMGAA